MLSTNDDTKSQGNPEVNTTKIKALGLAMMLALAANTAQASVTMNSGHGGGAPKAPSYLMAMIGMAAIGGFSLRKRAA